MYDLIAQNATGFSYRQCTKLSLYGRMEPVTDRLKRLRMSAGLSSRGMAAALSMQPSTYATYETALKFKKPILPLDLTKKIAEVLEPLGVDRAEIMQLAGITGELNVEPIRKPVRDPDADEWVEVNGAVQAGVWRAQSDWAASERYDVRFGPSKVPGAKRFGVRMEGLSMNRTIPPGADLECMWVKFSPVEPKIGDLVIVERTAHDLTEMTCKRLDKGDDGSWLLRCESFEPEFQEPIRVPASDSTEITDDEVRVIGIVLSAKIDLAPAGLSQRRYRVR
jgi:transcriptional regulator with XRE-family HTH domain